MVTDNIDYGKLVDEAMHVIVCRVLKNIQKDGLPGNHHFFISFLTKHPGVKISKALNEKYPREMTIVLQYQYQDLTVESKGFSVTLSFAGVKEPIYIPFSAITTFADPSVQFGLQFRGVESMDDISFDELDLEIDLEDMGAANPSVKKSGGKKGKKADNNLVTLDQFRGKKD